MRWHDQVQERDESAVFESGAGADQHDQMGRIDGAPPGRPQLLGFSALGDATCNAAQHANPSNQNSSAARASLRPKLRPPNHRGSANDMTKCPPTTAYSSRRRTRSARYRPVHSACAPAHTTTTHSATPAPSAASTHPGGRLGAGPMRGTSWLVKREAASRLSATPSHVRTAARSRTSSLLVRPPSARGAARPPQAPKLSGEPKVSLRLLWPVSTLLQACRSTRTGQRSDRPSPVGPGRHSSRA
jgi:hypothetical protein